MNVTMTGFVLYLIIAFSSYGHRDTYYYAIAGWAVFILPRSIVRVSSIGLYMQFPLNLSANGAVRRVAAHFRPVHLPSIPYARTRRNRCNKATAVSVQRLLGIRDEAAPGTENAQGDRACERPGNAEAVPAFRPRDRVLALCHGPYTAKIAEELCIAPGTAHTHMKRIYSKTDLHSRQALFGLYRAVHQLASAEEKPARESPSADHIKPRIAQKPSKRSTKASIFTRLASLFRCCDFDMIGSTKIAPRNEG